MDTYPWSTHEIANARNEERLLRAMAAYKALRGSDPGAIDAAVESRSARTRLLDRVLRREVGGQLRPPARPAV